MAIINPRPGYSHTELCPVVSYRLRGSPTEIPEKNLWFAVLYRAMYDAVHCTEDEVFMNYKLKDDVMRWFKSERYEEGSFLWIIAELNIAPGGVETILAQVTTGSLPLKIPER